MKGHAAGGANTAPEDKARVSLYRAILTFLPLGLSAGLACIALFALVQNHGSLPLLSRSRYLVLAVCVALSWVVGGCALGASAATHRLPARGTAWFRWVGSWVVLSTLLRVWLVPRETEVWAQLYWGGAGVGLSVLCLIPARWFRARGMTWLELVVFNAALIVVGSEACLRLYSALRPTPLLAAEDTSVERSVRARRISAGAFHYGFPANSQGFIDNEPEVESKAEQLVVVIGDSFSIGTVPHYYHYTTVAERELRTTSLYNMGLSGVALHEYFLLLQREALPLEPKHVVIGLFVGNDVLETVRRAESSGGDVYTGFGSGWLLPRFLERTTRLLGGGWSVGGQSRKPHAQVRAKLNTPAELHRVFPWLEDPSKEQAYLSEQEYLAVERERARFVCGTADEAEYAPVWQLLESMQHLAGRRGLSVLLIPDEFQVEDPLWVQLGGPAGLERDRPQRILKEGLRKRSIPVVDPLKELRDVAPKADGLRHLYHLQDTHLNRRGNDVVGKALARHLRQMLK